MWLPTVTSLRSTSRSRLRQCGDRWRNAERNHTVLSSFLIPPLSTGMSQVPPSAASAIADDSLRLSASANSQNVANERGAGAADATGSGAGRSSIGPQGLREPFTELTAGDMAAASAGRMGTGAPPAKGAGTKGRFYQPP